MKVVPSNLNSSWPVNVQTESLRPQSGNCDYCHREGVLVEPTDEIDGEPIYLCIDQDECKLTVIRSRYNT